MLVLNVRVFRSDFSEDSVEKAISKLHNVIFGEAGDFFPVIAPRVFKGVADNPLRTRPRDQLETLKHLFCLPVFNAGIKILFILTHDDDIHIRVFGFHKWIIGDAGSNVRILTERLSNSYVQALIPTALRRGDGSFQENLCSSQRIPGTRFDSGAVACQVNLLPNIYGFDIQFGAGPFQYSESCSHNLGANAVSVGDSDRNSSWHDSVFAFLIVWYH